MFIGSLVFQAFCSSSIAEKSKKYKNLAIKKEKLEKQIANLKFDDSNLSSLSAIEQEALELGLAKYEKPLLSLDLSKASSVAVVK